MELGADGLVRGMRYVASPNCDSRPEGVRVSLLVVHGISLPPGRYGGDAIERLFTNQLDPGAHPAYREVAALRVSAHFLIRRDGSPMQFVATHQRAWHAGVSSWRARERCNDFSIGIELEGEDGAPYEAPQYEALVRLAHVLCGGYPIRACVAHSDIAPGRKTDPGPAFDWSCFHERLIGS